MTPFYKVFIDNDEKREISHLVESLKYEDNMTADDVLELRIVSNLVEDFDRDDEIVKGTPLVFEFGFIGGLKSTFKYARVTDISYKYAATISITIKALDKGTVLKKGSSNKIWKGATTRFIVETIAERYDLTVNMDGDGSTWNSLPQSNLSDFEFLQQLALKEKDGNYVMFISGKELNFVRRGLDKESKITLTYRGGSDNILSFTPKQKGSTTSSAATSTTVVGFDPATKKPVKGNADNDTEKNALTLGEYKSVFNEMGDQIGLEKDGIVAQTVDGLFDAVGKIEKRIVSPAQDSGEATNTANSLKKDSSLKGMEAALITVGDPTMRSNTIITLAGVFDRHKGNYLIKKVVHSIASGGYTCSYELLKNGKSVVTTKVAEEANTKAGADKSDTEKIQITIYDENGDKVATGTSDTYEAPR